MDAERTLLRNPACPEVPCFALIEAAGVIRPDAEGILGFLRSDDLTYLVLDQVLPDSVDQVRFRLDDDRFRLQRKNDGALWALRHRVGEGEYEDAAVISHEGDQLVFRVEGMTPDSWKLVAPEELPAEGTSPVSRLPTPLSAIPAMGLLVVTAMLATGWLCFRGASVSGIAILFGTVVVAVVALLLRPSLYSLGENAFAEVATSRRSSPFTAVLTVGVAVVLAIGIPLLLGLVVTRSANGGMKAIGLGIGAPAGNIITRVTCGLLGALLAFLLARALDQALNRFIVGL